MSAHALRVLLNVGALVLGGVLLGNALGAATGAGVALLVYYLKNPEE